MEEVIDLYTVPVNNSLLTRTTLNVRRYWLAMPLGAGVLRWVLACRTIEEENSIGQLFL